jgi:hypothetical protein
MAFLQENMGTIIVATALAAIVAIIIIRLARRMRRGVCSNGCACCRSYCGDASSSDFSDGSCAAARIRSGR